MVGAADGFAGEIVECAGQPLGHLAAVDEEDGGVPLPNELEQTGMDRVPDGDAARHLRGGSAGEFLHGVEARHIFNWNFNAQL